MAKKHHMTKRQYEAYKKTHRRSGHAVETEAEKVKSTKSKYGNDKKKGDEKMRIRLRNIQEYSDDILNGEYDMNMT